MPRPCADETGLSDHGIRKRQTSPRRRRRWTARNGMKFYKQMQSHDGHFPTEYSGTSSRLANKQV